MALFRTCAALGMLVALAYLAALIVIAIAILLLSDHNRPPVAADGHAR